LVSLKETTNLIKKQNVKQVVLQFTDINGTLHSL